MEETEKHASVVRAPELSSPPSVSAFLPGLPRTVTPNPLRSGSALHALSLLAHPLPREPATRFERLEEIGCSR